MRHALTETDVKCALDQLFELQSLTEIGFWVALQLEEMESDDVDPVAKKLRSSMGYFIWSIGRLADPAMEILDEVETDLRRRRTQNS